MNYKKILNVVGVVAVTAVFIGCSEKPDDEGGEKGNDISKYRTITVNGQTWMAENLDYALGDSRCLAHYSSYCATYGRLYSWNDAKRACPSTWHLPTDEEWTTLENSVGGSSTAGTKLKSKTGWDSYSGIPAGTNDYGFSALPGGYGFSDAGGVTPPPDQSPGSVGRWWSATETEYNAAKAFYRDMSRYGESVGRDSSNKSLLLSVRCVKD